jgi:hypothetical protein
VSVQRTKKKIKVNLTNRQRVINEHGEALFQTLKDVQPQPLSPRDRVNVLKAIGRQLDKKFADVYQAEKLIDEQGKISKRRSFEALMSEATRQINIALKEEKIKQANKDRAKKPRERYGFTPAEKGTRDEEWAKHFQYHNKQHGHSLNSFAID